MRTNLILVAFAAICAVTSGCTTFKLPPIAPFLGSSATSSSYTEPGVGAELRGSDSAKAFKMVAEARSRNAIVLHLPGDQEPFRVLPLPGDGEPVFISDLLRQSGVQQKFGRVRAVLYRASAESINGIRMEVKMAPDGDSVRPESDYALRAGDRLEASRAPARPLNGMFTSILGV